jgi:hypothetical protein
MANATFSGALRTVGGKVRVVTCMFLVDAGNAPTLLAGQKLVESVARENTGVYAVKLRHAFTNILFQSAHFSTTSDSVDMYAQCGIDVVTAEGQPLTLIVKTKTGATNTNPPATGATVSTITVLMIFEDSSAF